MGEKALWPMVAVVFIVCAMVTSLAFTVRDVVALIAIVGVLFSGVGSLIGILVWGKVQKVEQNTNGNAAADRALILDLVDALKKSGPI